MIEARPCPECGGQPATGENDYYMEECRDCEDGVLKEDHDCKGHTLGLACHTCWYFATGVSEYDVPETTPELIDALIKNWNTEIEDEVHRYGKHLAWILSLQDIEQVFNELKKMHCNKCKNYKPWSPYGKGYLCDLGVVVGEADMNTLDPRPDFFCKHWEQK